MANKKKVDQSGFQLDKKALLEEVPMILRGPAGAMIDKLNSADFGDDGIADICQLAPYVTKVFPIFAAVRPFINVDKVVDWFVDHDFITDKAAVKVELVKLLQLADAASKAVAPPAAPAK